MTVDQLYAALQHARSEHSTAFKPNIKYAYATLLCATCGALAVWDTSGMDAKQVRAYSMELGDFHRQYPDIDLMASLYSPGDSEQWETIPDA